MSRTFVALAVLLTPLRQAVAQDTTDLMSSGVRVRLELAAHRSGQPGPRIRRDRWSLVAISATTSSGPARDVEAGMRAAGFGDPSGCWFFCSGSVQHPFSRTGWGEIGFPWLLELRHAWARPLELGLLIGNAKIGTTLGYDNQGDDFLFVEYAVRTWALVPDLSLGPLLVQAGPAWFRANSWRNAVGPAAELRSENRLGWVAGAGLSVRALGPAHLEVRVQYRAVGRATVGPYRFPAKSWIPGSVPTSFPQVTAAFSHWFEGVGIGLHF